MTDDTQQARATEPMYLGWPPNSPAMSPDEMERHEAQEAERRTEYARSQALMTISTVMAGSACTASHLINMAEEIAQYIQHGKPAREPVNLKPVEGT